jgi:hypothetical protein
LHVWAFVVCVVIAHVQIVRDRSLVKMAAPVEATHAPTSATFEADRVRTKEEVEALAALRARVGDVAVPAGDEYWGSDHALYRFLAARKWKVEDAAHMYRETIAFRSARSLATMLTTYHVPTVMRRLFPWGVSGLDKQGANCIGGGGGRMP